MALANSSFKVMSLTDAAAERVREIMENLDKPVLGLRVGVKNGGCAGMSYTMEFAESAGPHDEVIEDKGVKVLIDPKAILFLLGTQMDFQSSKLSSGFIFVEYDSAGKSADQIRQELNAMAAADEIDAYLVIPSEINIRNSVFEFRSRKAGDFVANDTLKDALNEAVRSQRLADANINHTANSAYDRISDQPLIGSYF